VRGRQSLLAVAPGRMGRVPGAIPAAASAIGRIYQPP